MHDYDCVVHNRLEGVDGCDLLRVHAKASGDHAADIKIPAIFVSMSVGALLKQTLASASPPLVQLYRPSDLPSPLVPGHMLSVALPAGIRKLYRVHVVHWCKHKQ
jgi:hypothetical protein